jgi:hypothetical protein
MGRRLQDLSPDGTRINVNVPPLSNTSRGQDQNIGAYTPTGPLVADSTSMISVGTSVADAPWPMPPVDVAINHPANISGSTSSIAEATVAAADAMQSHSIWHAEHRITPPIRAAGESDIGVADASRMIQQAAAMEAGSTWHE